MYGDKRPRHKYRTYQEGAPANNSTNSERPDRTKHKDSKKYERMQTSYNLK